MTPQAVPADLTLVSAIVDVNKRFNSGGRSLDEVEIRGGFQRLNGRIRS